MTDPVFTCTVEGCDFEVPVEKRAHVAQSIAMHRSRKHSELAEAKPNGVVATRRPRKAKHFDAFIQAQNVETATAYVLAAKWPAGIPVEDIPRVITLVKAVEHG